MFDWRGELKKQPRDWRDQRNPGDVIGSSFEDEGGEKDSKDPRLIWQTFATHLMRFTSARFMDWPSDTGGPPVTTHVEDFSDRQIADYVAMKSGFGLKTWSLGGRDGKAYADPDPNYVLVKLGPKNFVRKPWTVYLDGVKRHAEVCNRLGTKLARGFAFYRGINADGDFVEARGVRRPWAKDRVAEMAGVMKAAGVLFGVEWEANLEFGNGWEVAELVKDLGMDNLFIVPDLGNMAAWGYSVNEIVEMFLASVEHLLWLHIKDYSWFGGVPSPAGGPLDEHNLKHFCPCDRGRSGHSEVFYLLSRILPYLNAKAIELGLPGFGVELETHLWGGGQFGGLSRHEGIGLGLDALIRMLTLFYIRLQRRTYEEILVERKII